MHYDTKKRLQRYLLIALTALGIHYLTLILSWLLIGGNLSFAGIKELFIRRLTTPGDAERYLDIAKNGYVREGENAINLVFYPLYPLLIRALSFVTGDLAFSGLLISQLCYACASIVLYKWVALDRSSSDAWFSVLLLALYPYSVFVMGVFSEGLFLLLTIGCLYQIRRQRFGWAGAVGFLAALCRVQGMLLILPAVYELLALRFGEKKRPFAWKDLLVLLIPAGFGVYLGINAFLHGNPFQFLQYEAGEPWYQTSQWISRNIALQYSLAQQYEGLAWIIYLPQIALYFFALLALFAGIRGKHPTRDILYGAAYLGFTYLSGWMISGGRYMLSCVPLYAILAGLNKEGSKKLLLFIFALTNFIYSLMYYMGYAIM